MCKLFTLCMLRPMNQHLDKYELMEREQRGARVGCSGTIDNLQIDGIMNGDSRRKEET